MSDEDKPVSPEAGISPETLEFHLIKGANYRTIHVDGAICSITPRKNVAITLFNERTAIPQSILHKVSIKGVLEGAVEARGKTGVVRELEATLMLSPAALLDLLAQLNYHKDELVKAKVLKSEDKGATPQPINKARRLK